VCLLPQVFINGFVRVSLTVCFDAGIFVYVVGGGGLQILNMDMEVSFPPCVPQIHDHGGDDFLYFQWSGAYFGASFALYASFLQDNEWRRFHTISPIAGFYAQRLKL